MHGVVHRRLRSPIGELLVAATGLGIVRVAFAAEDLDAVEFVLARRHPTPASGAGPLLEAAARQLEEYFDGGRRSFELSLDLSGTPPFRRAAMVAMRAIPYGATATYAEVAHAAGNPRAVRAVGSACARNPVPILVPCHRVVRSDGTIGSFLGGTEVKAELQALEARHR
jgi:methylated-DNA-[protein]-cysteine S-methyltransferase